MGTETMLGFATKQAWLAVRRGDAPSVLAALGLRDLGPVPWRTGIDLAYLTDDRLVLTPPLPGAGPAPWLLVVGRLLMRSDAVDPVRLSASLGTEVQSFSTYRVTEEHGWCRAVDGALRRRFGFRGGTGEVTAWQGDPDPAERAAGLPPVLDDGTEVLVSEHDVRSVAHAWSVDPGRLDGLPSPGPLRAATPG